MKKITDIESWMHGKTIDKVQVNAINSQTFYFGDGTSAYLQTERMMSSLDVYGTVWYEREINAKVEGSTEVG